MKKGLHPMRHLVRIVLTNGATFMVEAPWQRPYPGLELTTKFLQLDYLTSEVFTGVQNTKPKVGRRAQFENKFKGAPDAASSPTSGPLETKS